MTFRDLEAKLDKIIKDWQQEFWDELFRDGDGFQKPKSEWDEFWEETWQQLKEGNRPR